MNRIDSLINNMIVKSGFAKHRSKCIHSGDMAHFADQCEIAREPFLSNLESTRVSQEML